jgi:hypothetical protein
MNGLKASVHRMRRFGGAVLKAGTATGAFRLVDGITIGAFKNGTVGAISFANAALNASIGIDNVSSHSKFPFKQVKFILRHRITYDVKVSQSKTSVI